MRCLTLFVDMLLYTPLTIHRKHDENGCEMAKCAWKLKVEWRVGVEAVEVRERNSAKYNKLQCQALDAIRASL
jgi:hypothetical protein